MPGIWVALGLVWLSSALEAPERESRAVENGETRVEGRLAARGRREPIAGGRILVIPHDDGDPNELPEDPAWIRRAETQADGTFALEAPPQPCRVIALAPGFERQAAVHDCGSGEPVTVYLRPIDGGEYRTVVLTARKPERFRVSDRVLEPVEIATLPGTQGDPLRALQNLPGVARAPGGLGLIVLRGASPSESAVFFGDHPIPRAFHALGFSSVVPADVIERLEVVPSNASSRYGNTVGGLTRLVPRAGSNTGVHGYGEIDLASAGAMVEGPVGDGSYIVGAQRGWIDGVLQTAEAIDRNVTFLLPRYYDYHGALDVPVSDTASVGMRVLGAGDRVVSRIQASPDPRENERRKIFEIGTSFHRFDLSFRKQHRDTRFLLTPAVRLDRARYEQEGSSWQPRRDGTVFTVRAEMDHRFAASARMRLGADLLVDRFHTQDPTFRDEEGAFVETELSHTYTSAGAYLDLELGAKRLTFWPGTRVSGFSFANESRAAVDPRFSMRWEPGERWDVRAGVGSYSSGQPIYSSIPPDLLGESSEVVPGLPIFPPALVDAVEQAVAILPAEELGVAFVQALQTSASVARTFGDAWRVELGAFGRWREGPLQSGALPGGFGRGFALHAEQRDVGMEVWIRRRVTRKLYGWIAYTLMHSEVTTTQRPSDYDQRHNLVLLASYRLPRNWRIGGRFRLVSGSPYTPVVGTITTDTPFTTLSLHPVPGTPNSARFPLYHQLDLRVDKRWILQRVVMTGYVDVQNVYNRQNVEAWFYDRTYTEPIAGLGLPIFPSLGFRIDF